MANKIVVVESNVSAPQLSDLFRQIGDGSLNGRHLQAFLEHLNPFSLDGIVIDWKKVYEVLGIKSEIDNEALHDPRFWTIPVFESVTPNKVVKALRDLGVDMYLYTENLDRNVPENDRDPVRDGNYVVKFQRTIEADPEFKNKSAETLLGEKIKGITLLERLLLELGYFLVTGNHLDVENVTLCSGSRYSDGHVPRVLWNAAYREVYVSWLSPSYSSPYLRARAVVS
ncbi:MAG: hypothetical protein WCP15_00675 [bacterium]